MKKYYFQSFHIIYEDDYTEGQGAQVNSYDLNAFINADSVIEALKLFVENTLYYTFDKKYFSVIEDENIIETSFLVDAENTEAIKKEIEMWKLNKIKLYSNDIQIKISELTEIKIKL